MRFRIRTLIDVTETGARKGQDPFLVKQQANFNTLYNTIGLRTNPTEFEVSVEKVDITKLGFGSSYKGRHKVWTVDFYVEAEESTSVELMTKDFDLIPVVLNIEETAKIEKGLFITSADDKLTNIVFERTDK